METVYTSVDMTAQLEDNQVVVLITDLKSGATFHHVWNKTLLPTAPNFTDKQRWSMAQLIVKQYALAQTLSTEDEQALIYQTETTILREYMQTSKAWANGIPLGHNSFHVAIDYSGQEFSMRPLGTSHADTVTEAIEATNKALIMGIQMGFMKPSPKGVGFTMIGVETPGSRTFPKRGAYGSNFTPKKKRRK